MKTNRATLPGPPSIQPTGTSMDPDLAAYSRRSIRLRGYDYASAGAYFVTICARDQMCLFGDIISNAMVLNAIGNIAAESWVWLERQYEYVELDEFVIMPNHLHGILVIDGNERVDAGSRKAIGGLIGAFKTVSTKRVNETRGTPGIRLWQRNYWERVARDESELQRIREYVHANPTRWADDDLRPGIRA